MKFEFINTTRVLSYSEYKKYDSENVYLFNDQLNSIKERIEEIVEEMNDQSKYDNYYNNKSNNTISIIGERGSGKSSLMGTVANILKEEGYFVLKPIDPSIFNDSLSVLEIFLSHIMDYISSSNYQNEYLISEIYHRLKGMIKTLSTLRVSKEKLATNTEETEFIMSINNQINFDKEMKILVKNFKELLDKSKVCGSKCRGIIICIDDLDMVENNNSYQMIENIRNYLSDHVITIISYREKQLLDAIIHKRIESNKTLIDKEIIDIGEIRTQSHRYLEKIIPENNRFYLEKGIDLYEKKISVLLSGVLTDYNERDFDIEFLKPYDLDGNVTVLDWLNMVVYNKLRITLEPIDSIEFSIYNMHQNLRGLLQLLHIIQYRLKKLPTIDLNDKNDLCVFNSKLNFNLSLYKKYILSYASEVLSYDDISLLNRWSQKKSAHKNHGLYMELSSRVIHLMRENPMFKDEIESKMKELLDSNYIEHYNITILDVYNILEDYKVILNGNSKKIYLVYILKQLYSIELLNSITKFDSNNYGDYLKLINGKIFEEESIKFSKHVWFIKYSRDSISKEILDVFGYTKLSEGGDVLKLARRKFYGGSIKSYQYSFRSYAAYISRDEIDKSMNNRSEEDDYYDKYIVDSTYRYNPFSKFIKLDYLKNIFDAGFKDSYIFYSLFDLDIFNRINYTRRSEDKPLGYVLRKINRIFKNDLNTHRENELVKMLSKNPYYKEYKDQEIKFTIFNDDTIEEFSNYIDIELKKDKVDKDLEKDLKMIKKKIDENNNISKWEFMRLIESVKNYDFSEKIKNQISDSNEHLNKPNSRVRNEEKILFNDIYIHLIGDN